ncbi:methylamine utilization protein MauJ [Rhizorhabdus sp.]|uniref:methylamine utilization protein MauJ n=1 Tax=Rhizorhabdus sp. TaxID=1968843 RepID=UPI0035B439F0
MAAFELKALQDALVGEIGQTGEWVIANINTSISWPVNPEKYSYNGRAFYIIPLTKDHDPAVACHRSSEPLSEDKSRLLKFLSALCWTQRGGAIVSRFHTDVLPRPAHNPANRGSASLHGLGLTYLPVATERRQEIALALMREGMGLNHPAYAFLSFFRVLEAALPHGKARERWTKDRLARLSGERAKRAVAALNEDGVLDVGEHLYRAGRQAIAHAKSDPIVNPDDAADYDKISALLPVIRELAEMAIEQELGIKSRSTVYQEHLYELDGFKRRWSKEFIDALMQGVPPEGAQLIDLPEIDVEIRSKSPYPGLCRLQPFEARQDNSLLKIRYRSPCNTIEFSFAVDFNNERLIFDIQNDLILRDNGSSSSARFIADAIMFEMDYYSNGELHIFDSESRELLSRREEYIPVNVILDHEAGRSCVKSWTDQAEQRMEIERQS